MADVHETIEIARDPETVFAYITDLPRQAEWQDTVSHVRVEGDGPVRVGTVVHETRRSPAGQKTITYTVTQLDGSVYAFEGGGGPVRVAARITVTPAGDTASQVTAEFTFRAGMAGKLFLPLLRREAHHHVPADMRRLKGILENGAGGPGD